MASMTSMFPNLNSLMGVSKEDNDTEIIDLSNISVATITANFNPKTQDQLNQNILRHLVIDTLRNNVVKFKGDYPDVVIAFDDDKYWRRQKAWYYKKKRKLDKEKSDWDWDRLYAMLHPIYDEIRDCMPYKSIRANFAEADDVIGVLTKHRVSQGRKVLVVSADSDFAELQEMSGVRQYSPTQKKWITPKYGRGRNDLRMKIIKGDKKDSIACIKMRSDYIVTKVEGERAPQIKAAELERWLEMDDPTTDMTPEWAERYRENEILRDFRFVPKDVADSILSAYDEPKKGSKSKMEAYFLEHKLKMLYNKLSDF